MNIIIIMLGKKLGGIEQVALDYCVALKHAGCNIVFVTAPHAKINAKAAEQNIQTHCIRNLGAWDRLAAWRIKRLCIAHRANAIISHGNRALNLVAKLRHKAKHITVAHNYLNKHFYKADSVFCITEALRQHVIAQHHIQAKHCTLMPNLIHTLPCPDRTAFHTPVRIAALGRMVKKKGFDVWLHALAELKTKHIPFEAWLAGDGEERASLEALCASLGLQDNVHFKGWIEDTSHFLSQCDIFCLPSHHEPFGVVLLEAMNAALPIISTASEGPSEIISSPDIATLVPTNDASKMADALAHFICTPDDALHKGVNAYAHVTKHYDLLAQAGRMRSVIEKIIEQQG